jgi:hypothetical protein
MDDLKVKTTERANESRRARRKARDAKDGASVLTGVLTEAARPAPRRRRRWPLLVGLLLAGAGAVVAARMMRASRDRSTDLIEDEHPSDRFDSNGVTPSPRRQPAGDQLHHSPN